MHPVLSRQLRRLGLDRGTLPADEKTWQEFLDRLDVSYADADANRYLLERSLQVSSREMHEMTQTIRETSERAQERAASHYQHLFSRVPVALWEQDYTAVAAWLDGLRASGVRDLLGYLDAHPAELRHGVSLINVVDINEAAVELNGVSDRSVLLGPIKVEMLDEPSVRSFIGQFQAIWQGETAAQYEFSSNTFSGRRLEAMIYWLVDSVDGVPDYSNVLVTIVDVTALKLTEERLAAQIETKDRFLASVSHELRTPLTGVVVAAELLREEWREMEPDSAFELMATIARESGELAGMVDDLLVATRMEISQIRLANRLTPVLAIVEEVLGTVRPHDWGKNVTVDVGDVVAYGDPLRIRQILRNLVTNAIRYGGNQIRVHASGVGERSFLAVEDDGEGVAAERRESIFEPYETAHVANGLAGSVGIGLTVARQLARLMDGDLRYEHRNGWTRFELDLPANRLPQARDPEAA